MRKENGITLIALIVTIIILIILAGVAINISIGEDGLLSKAKEGKEKYTVETIREKVEIGIMNLEVEEIALGNEVTIDLVLQKLLEDGTFETIDKYEKIGDIGEYEVKLKYNEEGKVVIEYIEKATGIRVIYTLEPEGYTKGDNVSILLTVKGKVKSVTKPDGLVIYPENETLAIDYEVTANGTYRFIIEDEEGNKKEKNVIVDTIDRLAPNDFEIIGENTGTGIKITAKAEDAESDGISVKSGIEKYEYFVKGESDTDFTKYDTNEIEGLEIGTYEVYVIVYDRAGNTKTSSTINVRVKQILRFKEISVGDVRGYGIDLEGNLWGWGNNILGNLGIGESEKGTINSAVQIKKGVKFKQIDAFYDYALAIDIDGNIWFWGNRQWLYGTSSAEVIYEPIQITTGTKFKKTSAGAYVFLALDENDNIWSCGYNDYYLLGTGDNKAYESLVKIIPNVKFKDIDAGDYLNPNCTHCLALDMDGNVWGWGYGTYYQFASEELSYVQTPQIITNYKCEKIAAGEGTSFIQTISGEIYMCGCNHYGHLGNGNTERGPSWKKSMLDNSPESMEVEISSGCTLYDGELFVWGYNGNGALGIGNTENQLTPVKVDSDIKFNKVFVRKLYDACIR